MNFRKKIGLLTLCCLLISCATYSPPSLPPNLQIIPPSPDVPHEVAIFSGIWEGSWGGMANMDSIVTVEKINSKTAEIIFSFGGNQPGYFNFTGDVLPGPIIRWETNELPPLGDGNKDIKCPCVITFEMFNDSAMIGYMDYKAYNFKVRGDFIRRKN